MLPDASSVYRLDDEHHQNSYKPSSHSFTSNSVSFESVSLSASCSVNNRHLERERDSR